MIAKTSFGQWLKQRRKALDLSREELASRIGCATNTLYKIEVDERRPSKQIAELLAQHLNIPADGHSAFIRFARAEATDDAAPWGTPFRPPTNLLTQPMLLIGRDEEVAALRRRLIQPETRLLTLTGPPGIGKTQLALHLATQVMDDFAHGVFFVALAPISDAYLVPTTIANTLGVPDVGIQTPLERLKVFLRDKQILLLLDNFEQILAAASPIAELLSACPWLKFLVTSRAALRVRHERQIPVSPLAVPDLARLPDTETLSRYSAITLFLERAQAVKPDFSLTQDNSPQVAALCTRLDGLPLAIELISARVKLLSPAALLERLHGRLLLQSDGLRDIEPRHRTLNAAIEWSYQLLNTGEQTLFRRLGVFVGGWTLEAAEAVCLENLTLNILDSTASLLDKNLVKQDTRADEEPRFILLETIRAYALEQMLSNDELADLHRRHADYFVALAETTQPGMTGRQQRRWWDYLEIEHDNFRAALSWSRTEIGGATELRLALALGDFWMRRGHLREGSGWLAAALSRQDIPSRTHTYLALRAKVLDSLGRFGQWQSDLDAAQPWHEESVALYRELGDRAGFAYALGAYGMLFVLRGDHERAKVALEEGLALSRELDNNKLIAQCLLFMGNLAYSQAQTSQASAFWQESLALSYPEDNELIMSSLLTNLAMVAQDHGDYDAANVYLIDGLTRLRELDERWQIAHTLEVFARLIAEQVQQSEREQEDNIRSARMFGAAEALRETLGAPVLPFVQHSYERGLAILRVQLDNTAFTAAWAEGRAMTLGQVVAEALNQKL